jgi:hypothetical protein
LGANENDLTENLIEEEFILGISNESCQRTKEETAILSNLTQIMKEFYQTTNSQMFVKASTQNCPDLIVNVGEFCIWTLMFEKFLEVTLFVFNASLILTRSLKFYFFIFCKARVLSSISVSFKSVWISYSSAIQIKYFPICITHFV